MPNFSSLTGLEVAEKFVVVGWVGGGWNTWLLCLTPTLVTLELLRVEMGFDIYSPPDYSVLVNKLIPS